jgi:hypothetical protein
MKQFIIAIVLLIGLIGGGAWVISSIAGSHSCTIGIAGSAANITFTGIGSQDVCDSTTQQVPQTYPYQGEPTGTELCSGADASYPSVTYTVRDTGLFDLIGSQICQRLQGAQE